MFSIPDLQLTTGNSFKLKRLSVMPNTQGGFMKSQLTRTS